MVMYYTKHSTVDSGMQKGEDGWALHQWKLADVLLFLPLTVSHWVLGLQVALLPEEAGPKGALHEPGPGATRWPWLAPQTQNHHRGQDTPKSWEPILPHPVRLLALPLAYGLRWPKRDWDSGMVNTKHRQ